MSERPQWDKEGQDWPNRAASRFVDAGGLSWHVQVLGSGPRLLLVHGTGAATHTWRDLAPLLARRFRVIAPDLPGHGFTAPPPARGLSLEGMAASLTALLAALGDAGALELAVGHSAGAAIAARLCLDGAIAPRALVSLNGALLPLHGLPGSLLPPDALLAAMPLVSRLFAWQAGVPSALEQLVGITGSRLTPEGLALHRRLATCPGHVSAALGMLAHWDLSSMERDLPRLRTPLTLLVGEQDATVPPSEAARVRAVLPGARVVVQRGLGHLAHEEAPAETARLIGEVADAVGLPAGPD